MMETSTLQSMIEKILMDYQTQFEPGKDRWGEMTEEVKQVQKRYETLWNKYNDVNVVINTVTKNLEKEERKRKQATEPPEKTMPVEADAVEDLETMMEEAIDSQES